MTAAAYINGSYRCFSLTNGTARHYLSCRHETPRQAIAHTSPTYVSPLRASAEPVHPSLSAPQPAASITGSADSPRGASPVQDTGQ